MLLGILLMLGALFLLGNVVLATALSVLVLGWTALVGGVVLLVRALVDARTSTSWPTALGGVVLAVLGLFMLRNPAVGALTLTLLTGALLLTAGLTRISSPDTTDGRSLQLLSGLVSAALGLFVLLNLTSATLTMLGVLVAVQTLLEGATLVAAGHIRPVAAPPRAPVTPGAKRR
ncbi:sulfate permease [Geodermatophilus normandii]|uniref:Sulfate permease n=1 Tax=Geodermatophilus normandii TaxID=1137989 RepID=A0A6P0GIA1_9ACTN|nr:sulfate permease [Geodermatophilus normandii]